VDTSQGGTNYNNALYTAYGAIVSNSVNSIYLSTHLGPFSWTNGDRYAIYEVYAMLDQPGRGQGDLVADTAPQSGLPYNTVTGKTNWPNEDLEPWYDWCNSNNGVAVGFDQEDTYGGAYAGESGWPTIIQGRDYYDYTVKPSYVPLPFPHPLDTMNSVSTLPTFTLTVVNGSGSSSYTNGANVNISANAPGMTTNAAFAFWSGPDIANTNSASTTVTMPASNLTVTADYVPDSPTNLTVVPAP
jgi:hypothetical protein